MLTSKLDAHNLHRAQQVQLAFKSADLHDVLSRQVQVIDLQHGDAMPHAGCVASASEFNSILIQGETRIQRG